MALQFSQFNPSMSLPYLGQGHGWGVTRQQYTLVGGEWQGTQ